jgi:hypothetical protein
MGAGGIRGEDEAMSDDSATPSLRVATDVPKYPARGLSPAQRRQIALITAGAVGVFLLLRFLPTGTNLSHMDFRVDAKNSIEFCDPLNPQFIPVVAVKSPVAMTIAADAPPVAGREARCGLTLRTATGKPIAPEDLLVAHTRKLHLLIVDPTLADYQHVHPEPRGKGEWSFAFTPRLPGEYRVFADFTPTATGRGLYASSDISVGPGNIRDNASAARPTADLANTVVQRDGYRFSLVPGNAALRVGQPIDLALRIERSDGGPVTLEPVMGAFAHLVAFDATRSGFAHLHPMETDLTRQPDAIRPTLNFKVTIPRPGRYVIWAQVNLVGRETFVPFWFEVRA